MESAEYYRDAQVRGRIAEYLGGSGIETATCMYISRCGEPARDAFGPQDPGELDEFLANRREICRSLWDRRYLLAHIDMEYVNFDFPAEPFLDPLRTFALQQPVAEGIQQALIGFGIRSLHLLTGRGHHFTWQIGIRTPAFRHLAEIGSVAEHLRKRYAKPVDAVPESISADLGAAFDGLGKVMEYLALRIQAEQGPHCAIPVEITDVKGGPCRRGREAVSIDLSEYGDPLDTRIVRTPFSLYLKPSKLHLTERRNEVPTLAAIPLDVMDVSEGIVCMRDLHRAADLAARTSCRIPEDSAATENLVAAYRDSDLAEFHRFFYAEEPQPPSRWPETYDRMRLDMLPVCVAHLLRHPNPLLLEPAAIRQVVRTLLALGWHPRHIAGLLRSRYERNYGWGATWFFYDAATRTDFYTRLFAGAVALGRDQLVDYNCVSTREKQLCVQPPGAACGLEDFRKSLIERRNHGRLADRPIDGLFLPDSHT